VQRPAPFSERTTLPMDLAPAINAAAKDGQRVLVIWGRNAPEQTQRLWTVVQTPDMQRALAIDYRVVWVNVAEGPSAEGNLALTVPFGAKITPQAEHAWLTVLDDQGQVVAQSDARELLDARRPGQYSPLKLQDFLLQHRAVQPTAREALDGALAKARERNVGALVRFVDHGDAWAEKFEAFLARPEVAKIIERICVTTRLHGQRNEGAFDLLESTIPRGQGFPLYALFGPDGSVLARSQPEGGRNIGFPTTPSEIQAFLDLLDAGPGKLTEAERGELTALLKANAAGAGR
jgi:hypothetical protein